MIVKRENTLDKMSRTKKLIYSEAGLKKSFQYYSSGNPFCIRCNHRSCTGESEKPRGNKSLGKTKFRREKYQKKYIEIEKGEES